MQPSKKLLPSHGDPRRLAVRGVRTALLCLLGALAAPLGHAQTTANNVSGAVGGTPAPMWGGVTGGGAGSGSPGLDSSVMHFYDGQAAGYVQAARDNSLYAPGSSITVQTIGSQSVISTSIYGNDNVVRVDARQESVNSGDVTTQDVIIKEVGLK